jgi:hypothetical protein
MTNHGSSPSGFITHHLWTSSLYDYSQPLSFSNEQSSVDEERFPRFTTVVPWLTYYITDSRNIRQRLSIYSLATTYDDSVMIPLSPVGPNADFYTDIPLCVCAVAGGGIGPIRSGGPIDLRYPNRGPSMDCCANAAPPPSIHGQYAVLYVSPLWRIYHDPSNPVESGTFAKPNSTPKQDSNWPRPLMALRSVCSLQSSSRYSISCTATFKWIRMSYYDPIVCWDIRHYDRGAAFVEMPLE